MGRPRIQGKPILTIGVSEEIGDRLEALKAEEEAKLGFKMSYGQFVSMLVKHFEEHKENT
jgi:hypothetical protein